MAGFAAGFFQQAHVVDDHAAIDRFAHIVNGQQRDLHTGERLHFDPGLARGFCGDGTFDGIVVGIDVELDGDVSKRQWVTHRYQLRGSLGRHDTGNAGDAEHITLLVPALLNQFQRLGLHDDAAAGNRAARARSLVGNIDHMGFAGLIEVCQFAHARNSITLIKYIARDCHAERS